MWLRIDIAEPGRARAIWMIVIECLLGLAAIPGGIGLIRDGLGMNRGWIDHTLLPGWEIPGLLLAVVIGGGMLSAALISFRWPRLAAPAGLVMGVVLGLVAGCRDVDDRLARRPAVGCSTPPAEGSRSP